MKHATVADTPYAIHAVIIRAYTQSPVLRIRSHAALIADGKAMPMNQLIS